MSDGNKLKTNKFHFKENKETQCCGAIANKNEENKHIARLVHPHLLLFRENNSLENTFIARRANYIYSTMLTKYLCVNLKKKVLVCDFNFELPMNFLGFNFGLPMTFVGSTFIGCPTGRCAASSASPCLGSPSARTQMSAGNTPEIEIILKQNKIFYNKIKIF